MNRSTQRLLALGFGLGLSSIPLLGLELKIRSEERSRGFRIPWDEPGRKYALTAVVEGSTLNEQGFQERPFEAKVEGRTRVVVLGDSITYGSGVPQALTWPRVTEGMLRAGGWDVEVLNLAIYGYDIEQIGATLRYQGWELEPDLVVYAGFTNDHIPTTLLNLKGNGSPVFVGSSIDDDVLLTTESLDLLACRFSAGARRFFGGRLARKLAEEKQNKGHNPGTRSRPGDWDWYSRELSAMAADVEAHGIELLTFAIPPHAVSNTDKGACGRELSTRFCEGELEVLNQMLQASHEAGVPWFDASSFYILAPEDDFYRPDVDDPHHPNPQGHEALARGAAQALLQWRDGVDMSQEPPPPAEDKVRGKRPPRKDHGRSSSDKPSSRDRPPPVDTRAAQSKD